MPYRAIITAALQSAGLYAAGFLLPFIGQIAMLFAPVPLVLLFVRQGRAAGNGALVLAALIAAVLAWGHAAILLLFMSYCLTALGLAEGILRRMKPERSVFLGGFLPYAAVCISLSVLVLVSAKNPVTASEDYLRSQLVMARDIYTRLGLTDLSAAVAQISSTLVYFVSRLLPGIILSAVLLQAALCYGAVRIAILRRSPDSAGMFPQPLSLWHAPDTLVWGLIGTLALIAWGVLQPVMRLPLLFGLNLVCVYALLYTVQGIAVVEYAVRKARKPFFLRMLLIAALIFSPPLVVVFFVLGVIDIWVDHRKVRQSPLS